MKKIIVSLTMIAAVAAVAVGATSAFFSDTETSSGNTFTAGAIDLGIDNESYLNGVRQQGTSWTLDYDLSDTPRLLFNFLDLKPGDYGEDTISLHVNNNPAWACADTTVTKNDDMDCTEPELDHDSSCDVNNPDVWDGDLAQKIEIMWWADDGDNVLEVGETVLNKGNLGQAPQDTPVNVTLADAQNNIWTPGPNTPLDTPPNEPVYIAKAWCFGTLTAAPDDQDDLGTAKTPAGDNDGNSAIGEPEDGGFTCTGASVISNASQTDSVMLDVTFRAVQSRNNAGFDCQAAILL